MQRLVTKLCMCVWRDVRFRVHWNLPGDYQHECFRETMRDDCNDCTMGQSGLRNKAVLQSTKVRPSLRNELRETYLPDFVWTRLVQIWYEDFAMWPSARRNIFSSVEQLDHYLEHKVTITSL